MIRDSVDVQAGTVLRADLCIVGAGAAGITLARSLANASCRVCLLESGGLEVEPASQELNRGVNVGLPYLPLEIPRLRVLGGTTMHWGGFIAPLDPIDFEERSWIPHSGWPFSYDALAEYYPAAQEMCDSGPFAYDVKYWDDPRHRAFPFKGDRITAGVWQHSRPARFGAKYRGELAGSAFMDAILHATVVALDAGEAGDHLRGVEVRSLEGNAFRVEAARYVLACGGLENPRLLLASRQRSESGVANDRGLVGRFYAGHPRIEGVMEGLLYGDRARPLVYEFFKTPLSPYPVTMNIRISEAAQRREGLANTAFRLFFPDTPNDLDESIRPTWLIEEQPSQRSVDALFRDLMNIPGEAGRPFVLRSHAEPVPNPDSRVTLADETDALGQPRVKLEWRLTDADRDQLRRAARLVASEFGRAGLGRLRLARWVDDAAASWPPEMFGSWHHMGTTRMGSDPASSVADANGRTHQVDNLYLAGSSVFPTFGWATPTLTIVALALRLADHLKGAK